MKCIALCFSLALATTLSSANAQEVNHPTYSKVVLWAVGFERDDQTKIETSVIKSFAKKRCHRNPYG